MKRERKHLKKSERRERLDLTVDGMALFILFILALVLGPFPWNLSEGWIEWANNVPIILFLFMCIIFCVLILHNAIKDAFKDDDDDEE